MRIPLGSLDFNEVHKHLVPDLAWYIQSRSARRHMSFFIRKVQRGDPFRYVRFSDGEVNVLNKEPVLLSQRDSRWAENVSPHIYQPYDHKTYVPDVHIDVYENLVAAATHRGVNYFKGIPTGHNSTPAASRLMIELNGDSLFNLTFADLFTNSNYGRFVRKAIPLFLSKRSVTIVGNYRMEPWRLDDHWQLLALQDDFFPNFRDTLNSTLSRLVEVPRGSLVLSSASSLSNALGAQLDILRPDITFIDVGTALHPFTGLGRYPRAYHEAWVLGGGVSTRRRIRLWASPSFWIRW